MLRRFRSNLLFFAFAFNGLAAWAGSPGACRNYAREAVDDYNRTVSYGGKCAIKADPRWQPNYQNHYKWCLAAPADWIKAEAKARDKHLIQCGARVKFDNSQ